MYKLFKHCSNWITPILILYFHLHSTHILCNFPYHFLHNLCIIWCILFNFQLLDFSDSLQFIFSLILLLSENFLCNFNYFNLVHLLYWPEYVLSSRIFHVHLRKEYTFCCCQVGCSTNDYWIKLVDSIIQVSCVLTDITTSILFD